ncbi:alpha/beta hydrolase [Amycolatopsis sp. 195334CR]|uniref:alpha/beta hydrolase n=1 Tax=Amycolatopsis sp. 195334CR TaxID=2814588 RepID=UPI001A8EF647|nr:alpha/beta fold hydrolase [Amycolatopsis sp. 195334CR]MBN6037042.1 alpha/beta fold hydrolase [Amycolatopsis sp. 195334CR]
MIKGEALRARVAAMPGVHRLRRPLGDGRSFDLHYVRAGPPSDCPLLVVPGGPGLASVLPYHHLRREAAARGLDVVMVEHRGVGLSRTDDNGDDLPFSALTVEQVVEDLAAVLDDCGVRWAVVYGSSYGTYLAQGLGVRHPGRVRSMVLDSPMLSADDDHAQRAALRELYLGGPLTGLIDAGIVAAEETGQVLQVVHEFGGKQQVERLLALMASGRGAGVWRWLHGLGELETTKVNRFVMEFDLVGAIAFGELGFAPEPDGEPLDVNLYFADLAPRYPPFRGEPFDLTTALRRFHWPVAVLSGDNDIRTPRSIAARIASLAPDGVLVPLADTGHSALDTHRRAALTAARIVADGGHRRLPRLAPRLAALPRRGPGKVLGRLLTARLVLGRLISV